MELFSLGKEVVIAILTAFLALSNGAAHTVEKILQGDTFEAPAHEEQLEAAVSSPISQHLSASLSAQVTAALRIDPDYLQAQALPSLGTTTEAAAIEDALVNIFCTARGDGSTRATTGSGVFIDSRGVILTNAHVAQFLLLEGDAAGTKTECVIRMGDPAEERYNARLLYISPTWIEKNAHQLYAERPSGTGERDFALLYVESATEGSVPDVFPSLSPLAAESAFNPDDVRVAGYPAEMLTPEDTGAPLSPLVATSSVTRLFTFSSGRIDLIGIAPSAVGQQGSSGGPIVSDEGMIVGLIVTRGNPEREGERSLRALTVPYIDRTLTEETGIGLSRTLSGDIALRAATFRDTLAPHLRELLIAAGRETEESVDAAEETTSESVD